jgi:DNA-binding transcriptional regulator YhcF (GntR family)
MHFPSEYLSSLTIFTKFGIFTTVVNMDEFVNTLNYIEKDACGSGVSFRYDESGNRLYIATPVGESISLKLTQLYRPSSSDVTQNAAPNSLLVITAASEKAAKAASQHNHILVPGGGYRIIAPGVALIHDSAPRREVTESRQVRLMGRTGVLAESLLQGGRRTWSVRQLAAASHVSPGLAQRVINRLEQENLLTSSGFGPEKTRTVLNPRALAELWSQEEKAPKPVLRGFLYGASNEVVAQRIIDLYPGSAVGDAVAANLYTPMLTRTMPPVRIWIDGNLDRNALDDQGFQETDEGANIELVRLSNAPWQVHMNADGLPRVSKWRAWIEVSRAKGRVQELADALMIKLEEEWHGTD